MNCTLCKLHRTSKCNCIPGCGPEDASFMLIGMAPGAEEEQAGANFVGDSGKLLDTALTRASLQYKDVFLGNAIRCRPKGKISNKQIDACRPYLVEDLLRVKPKVCVLAGNEALLSVLGFQGIKKRRGFVFESDEFPGIAFLPTFHPAYILRSLRTAYVLVSDIRKAAAVEQDPDAYLRYFDRAQYNLCETVEDVRAIVDYFLGVPTFAYDLETTSLNVREAEILYISLSNRIGTAYVIPLMNGSVSEKLPHIKRLFSGSNVKVGHNIVGYDNPVLYHNLGIEIPRALAFDTMLAHYLVDENAGAASERNKEDGSGSHSLEFLQSMYTTVPPYKHLMDPYKGKEDGFKSAPKELLIKYSAADADVTWTSHVTIQPQLDSGGLRRLHDELMVPLTPVLEDMTEHGVLLDVDGVKEKTQRCLDKAKDVEKEIFKLAKEEFNPNSTKQLRHVLYDKLGLKTSRKTKTGLMSTDADTLEALKDVHPICAKIVEMRHYVKWASTFLAGRDMKSGIFQNTDENGRVHVKWWQIVTVTGRLSCKLHTIPRPDEVEYPEDNIRPLYISPPGWYFVGADYKQVELRVAAILSGDPVWLSIFARGEDPHAMSCSEALGIPLEQVTPQQRQLFKVINYQIQYGGGAEGVAENAGISVEESIRFLDVYNRRFSVLSAFMQECQRKVYRDGLLTNVFGRQRRFQEVWEYNYQKKNQLVPYSRTTTRDWERVLGDAGRAGRNFGIQSASSDILGFATIRIYDRLKDEGIAHLLITHHDALDMEVREERLLEVARITKEEMERPVSELGGNSLPIDLVVGRFWGDDSETCLIKSVA